MAWIFGLAALMLLDSDTVLNAVNGAAGVFVRSVMPALFPMMVLNGPVRPAERTGEALDDGGLLLAGGFARVGPTAGGAVGTGRAARTGASALSGGDRGHEPAVFRGLAGQPPCQTRREAGCC